MATDASSSDFQAFHDFVGHLNSQDNIDITPEQSVVEFRQYQQQLAQFQQKNKLAMEQSSNNLSQPLDLEALLDRVKRRLAASGTGN